MSVVAVSLLQLIYRAWASALTLPSPAHCQMTTLVAVGAIAEWELMRNYQSSNRYSPHYAECLLFNPRPAGGGGGPKGPPCGFSQIAPEVL